MSGSSSDCDAAISLGKLQITKIEAGTNPLIVCIRVDKYLRLTKAIKNYLLALSWTH